MSTIGERLEMVIDSVGIKKIEAAKRLNVSSAFITQACKGTCGISDRTILDICRQFNVNEIWLRTGEGEMFIEMTQDEIILDYVASLVKGQNTELQKQIIGLMAQLPKELWDAAEQKIKDVKAARDNEKGAE